MSINDCIRTQLSKCQHQIFIDQLALSRCCCHYNASHLHFSRVLFQSTQFILCCPRRQGHLIFSSPSVKPESITTCLASQPTSHYATAASILFYSQIFYFAVFHSYKISKPWYSMSLVCWMHDIILFSISDDIILQYFVQ